MHFDARAVLTEILDSEPRPPATSATPATQGPETRPMSRMSQVSQGGPPENGKSPAPAPVSRVSQGVGAENGKNANPAPRKRHDAPRTAEPDAGGITWTGRVVSLDEWRSLSEWDRHGPNGRLWCGLCREWRDAQTAMACADSGKGCEE